MIDPDSPYSRQGLYNLDPTRKGFGYGVDGAMTRFVRVPSRCLHHLPDSLSFEQAGLTEPCCVAYNAVVMNAAIKPGDRVVVLGPGPIGILCGAMARLQGAEVAVVGLEARPRAAQRGRAVRLRSDRRRARRLGPRRRWTGGRRRDRRGRHFGHAQDGTRHRPPGRLDQQSGLGPAPFDHSLDPLVQKNITLRGSFSHNWPIWERVIRLLSTNQLDVSKIIGGIWSLEDWHTAFEEMHCGRIVKAVLKPGM